MAMNVSGFLELQRHLMATATAGVGLASEDFRLKRAIDRMEPLAAASPVIRRITDMAKQITRPDQPNRAGLLLETLGLLEAVLKTQGTFSGPGETGQLKPVDPVFCGARAEEGIPYSRLAPLLEALTGSGNLRYATIMQAHEETPEIFTDYRVRTRMVKALGDGYGELADTIERWLREEGNEIAPLLKEDFRTDGVKGMDRRLRILGEVSKEKENAFYCRVLPEASRELRVTAITTLRYTEENEALLLDLVRSEKGKAKKAAMWALSFLDTEEAADFWRGEARKHPQEAVELLRETDCDYASDILAGFLRTYLREKASGFEGLTKEQKKGKEETERRLIEAVKGKHSPAMCDCYPELHRFCPEDARDVLTDSLLLGPHPALIDLAGRLRQENGDDWLEPAFLASMLSEEPEQVYEQFSGYFLPGGLRKCFLKSEAQTDKLQRVLERLKRNEKDGGLVFLFHRTPGMAGGPLIWHRLPVVLDERWISLFLRLPVKEAKKEDGYDRILSECYVSGDPTRDVLYGRYFYNRAMERGTRAVDIKMLKACGWEDFHGLIEQVQKGKKPLPLWQMKQILEEIPLSGPEKGGELNRLLQKQKSKTPGELRVLENWRDNLLCGFTLDD
ncbi:MAG: hypothetical protein HFI93_00495 [Lachnospiraceae bacterium]|nr:hypothetical protein [Lachnospiraceae bacterium]